MPRLSYFYGISIYVYFRDHGPPHFHAIYGGEEAAFTISDLDPIAGRLSPRALALVRAWWTAHREDLDENWSRAQRGSPMRPIEPLE